jgi:hypothetical protein
MAIQQIDPRSFQFGHRYRHKTSENEREGQLNCIPIVDAKLVEMAKYGKGGNDYSDN